MATQKARLQVVLADEPAERVKALAKERGLSVSAMCSQLIHAALELVQYQPKPDLSQLKGDAVKAAIKGGNISDFKIAALLSLVEDLTKDSP